ncbi:MAG: hypothetical protein IJ576_08175 [Synergistaceae bacterium]|nr:hypothetical protein [Synergistaceae bacterium]
MEPISLLMSHFNVEHNAQHTPHALAAAQDTVQGQELVKDSIRVTQTVQANEAAAEAQNIHRKTQEEEREERRRNSQDSFERSGQDKDKDNKDENNKDDEHEHEGSGNKNIIDFINSIKNKQELKEHELKDMKEIKENKEIKNQGDNNLNQVKKKDFEFYA